MAKIPPTPQIPSVPGGVPILGQPQPQIPQRTRHDTKFHGCSIGLFALLDEDNICQGYKLQILDPFFNHVYEADFGDDVMDEWRESIPQMPKVGEKAEGGEEVAGFDGGN